MEEKTFIEVNSDGRDDIQGEEQKTLKRPFPQASLEPPGTSDVPGKNAYFKNKVLYFYFALALIVIIIAGYILLKDKLADSGMSPQMRQVKEMVDKVKELETGIQKNQDELFALMSDYKNKTGEELPAVNLLNLSPEEKNILEEKIKAEEDVSIKALLNEIIEKNNDINDLKAEIKRLEELLPAPHIVQLGENHYQIAMDFLLNQKGVEKEKATELVEQALLFDPLVPGFKVWNFYSGEEYGTFVTQGSAAISPNEVSRRAKKVLVDAKDKAIAERDKLALDIEALEARRTDIISQLELLNREKQQLITQIGYLNKDNWEMQTRINSLYYMIDLEKNLKKQGIIKGSFLKSPKLKKVSPEYFTKSIDLRTTDTIEISAADFTLKKIKNILLYPKFYHKGIDYKVIISPDKQTAQLIIHDTTKLKNERVVISVE